MNETWGNDGEGDGQNVTPEQIRLKNGYLWVTREAWVKLLHSPPVVEAVKRRAQEICDYANANAEVKGAVYKVTFEEDEEKLMSYSRFRAFVRPVNHAAVEDEHRNGTLSKALNYEPAFNDPMPSPMPAPPGAVFPEYEDSSWWGRSIPGFEAD